MQERDSRSPAGPQKQLQFEVSVNAERDVYHFPLRVKLGQWQYKTQKHTLTCTVYEAELTAVLFQELECAVSMEEDNRQEWTFTLYDFDNNGKVTRQVKIK